MSSQSQISCMLIRGGTSKGAYFRGEDLPNDIHERDEVLLRVMALEISARLMVLAEVRL